LSETFSTDSAKKAKSDKQAALDFN